MNIHIFLFVEICRTKYVDFDWKIVDNRLCQKGVDKMSKNGIVFFTKLCYDLYRIEKDNKGRWNMKNGGYSAMDIAQWFIWKNKVEQMKNLDNDDYDIYEGITHLKVQKLIYFAEGIFSAVYGTPLFNEKIYAWEHGPVVKEVYNKLFINGRNEIEFDDKYLKTIEKIENDSKIVSILQDTYDTFGGYTAWQLRNMTHIVGGPWQVTVDTKGMQKEISKVLIEKYFRENIVNVE